MADQRKEWVGGAPKTTLASPATDVATTLTISDGTGWPTGASYPFVVTLARGQADEEKVLVTTRSGTSLIDCVRGHDGTTPQAHAAGIEVEHTLDAETVDAVNRLANLFETQGSIYVYDGASVIALTPSADDEMLVSDSGEASGLKFMSRFLDVLASAPTYEAAGDSYFDTTRNELMVGVGGVWESAAMGVVVFANAAARDALFGASGAEPPGRLAFLADVDRLYVGTGAGWQALPKPGEWVGKYADTATRDSDASPVDGDVCYTQADQKFWAYRDAAWYQINPKITVSASAPIDPVDGDLWLEPVT